STMPLYEYQCQSCDHKFELTQSLSAKPEETTCPHCHGSKTQRLMSPFASQVKGPRKPGFSEIKAYDMCNERMSNFAKLPPVAGQRAMPGPANITQPTDSGSGDS
ncbi:MAG: zinc ribbon domain-containing protein, partial [Nitrospirota bacterium]|nr:zinc ribbon domain-containing protein [Nitrospirota bacterium]